jgi:hypothetical protein
MADDGPFVSERAFKQRLDFHLFAAAIWGTLAKDAMTVLGKETWLAQRTHYEAFITRAVDRALDHYLKADAVRQRGYLHTP